MTWSLKYTCRSVSDMRPDVTNRVSDRSVASSDPRKELLRAKRRG